MKKYLNPVDYMRYALLMMFALFTGVLFAQDDEVAVKQENVPSGVMQKFKSMFPDVERANWTKEKGKYYAAFEHGAQSAIANFDSKGTWIETETELTKNDLPPAVAGAVSRKYAGWRIEFVAKTTSPKGTTYEVSLKGEGEVDVTIDEQGTILKTDGDGDDD